MKNWKGQTGISQQYNPTKQSQSQGKIYPNQAFHSLPIREQTFSQIAKEIGWKAVISILLTGFTIGVLVGFFSGLALILAR